MNISTRKTSLSFLIGTALTLASTSFVHGASVSIDNPGFENGFDGWADTDPSAVSGNAYAGSSSAKISGTNGKVEQYVDVTPNTDYTLKAYVKGIGKIGADVNGTRFNRTGGGSDFEPVSVSFNSGSATSVKIYANYYGGEGRFDNFTLESAGSTTPPGNSTCSGNDSLSISTATDNGTNDGHGPLNTIDNDLTDESRWSSNGTGKTITYDLGEVATVKALQVKWFKGNTRSSFFDVHTSTNNSNWNAVLLSGASNGSSSGYETHDVTDSDARYVRITGLENSANTWNSIVETNIYGCGGDTDNTPDPTPTPTPTPGNFDMSDWDMEGADPRVGDTMEFDALREQHVTPNGNGWRHELKIKEEKRVAMTAVFEDFQANIKVEMSDGSKAIVAQHHASDTGTIMKLYVSDTSETGFTPTNAGVESDSVASNGIFDVYVRLAREDGSGEDKQLLGTMVSGQNFDFRVINDHGYVTVSAFGESFSRTIEDSTDSYLKFGNYLQAQDPETREDVDDSDDWAAFYASEGITESLLTFSSINYIRDED